MSLPAFTTFGGTSIERAVVQCGLGVAACQSHQDLTANYTFAEIDFVVRRAFLRSTQEEDGLANQRL